MEKKPHPWDEGGVVFITCSARHSHDGIQTCDPPVKAQSSYRDAIGPNFKLQILKLHTVTNSTLLIYGSFKTNNINILIYYNFLGQKQHICPTKNIYFIQMDRAPSCV